jgi:hypothetical protein
MYYCVDLIINPTQSITLVPLSEDVQYWLHQAQTVVCLFRLTCLSLLHSHAHAQKALNTQGVLLKKKNTLTSGSPFFFPSFSFLPSILPSFFTSHAYPQFVLYQHCTISQDARLRHPPPLPPSLLLPPTLTTTTWTASLCSLAMYVLVALAWLFHV